MDSDEQAVCNYLDSWPEHLITAREIGRRAAGRWRYRQEPEWATPVLARLVAKGVVETNGTGQYRLARPREDSKCSWIGPHFLKMLQQSGPSDAIPGPDAVEPDKTEVA